MKTILERKELTGAQLMENGVRAAEGIQIVMHQVQITGIVYICKHCGIISTNITFQYLWNDNMRDYTAILPSIEINTSSGAQRVLFVSCSSFLLCHQLQR